MFKINYIAFSSIPSALPSSIQIIKTCESFARYDHTVTLIKPGTGNKKISIKKYYNLKHSINIKEFKSFNKFPRGLDFYLYSLKCLLFILKEKNSINISRNYFICFLTTLFNKKTILEIHHDTKVEGKITKFILRYTNFFNKNALINIIAISNSVKNLFINKYKVNPQKINVLPSGSSIRLNYASKINKDKRLKIGYFGSLSFSKGVHTFIKLSKIDKENDYYIFGGDKKLLLKMKTIHFNDNLFLKENIPYKDIPKTMLRMDILTLPYTNTIKVAGEVDDISNFTSPLKLFDYLAVGKVIISSDLKVLREIINKNNAFFVKNYENIYEWKKNILIAKNNKNRVFIMGKKNYKLSMSYDHLKRVKKYFRF